MHRTMLYIYIYSGMKTAIRPLTDHQLNQLKRAYDEGYGQRRRPERGPRCFLRRSQS
ncbi:hypothetical protein MPLB_1730051 [Mesorhizobium sp. ORS 3324]|nr:hypothetical protein MPLB_1730051 [Mesorhizobium sp. ORS 3324]